ncbi:hypothetical protein RZR97_05230 [Hydrogenimonas thermophila]|uniref:Cas10/Cmr2 second palm domain-containing protein n=1 Tax=Hydrogenimonas thermophila TaxID=223786 RepID=UPI0029373220|nr:hypothetical protein [Hydrogenimonas thermophila]WOE70977.1 hypothetical protein RZR91_05250 [Hydrogenimonas thermophila]WOE73495.1 hypothetical protein RZR97_05230 [Hydrogenimonas thermophila]
MAAGNVRIHFKKKDDAQALFRIASKKVMQKAFGITLSQAIVETQDLLYRKDIDCLEERLKSARNRVEIALDASLNATHITPRTGRSASAKVSIHKKTELVDTATKQKDNQAKIGKERLLKKIGISEEEFKKFPNEMDKLANSKGKIAVIHIDGNGLGMLLQKIGETLEKDPKHLKKAYRDFSKQLDESTKNAVKRAFDDKFSLERNGTIRFRPVVLGGDDLTIICDADRSLGLCEAFLKYFEEETQEKIGKLGKELKISALEKGLSACGGIAYCNAKFPFHYAVEMAEALTAKAKQRSKEIDSVYPPSSIMFHNIQSTYFEDFDSVVERELTLNTDKGEIRLDFGPYFLIEEPKQDVVVPTIGKFMEATSSFMGDNTPIGKLRNWLDLLEESESLASSVLRRIVQISKERNFSDSKLKELYPGLSIENLIFNNKDLENEYRKTPIYDILQIHAISGVMQ